MQARGNIELMEETERSSSAIHVYKGIKRLSTLPLHDNVTLVSILRMGVTPSLQLQP